MSGKALEGCCELVQEKITDFAASIRAPGPGADIWQGGWNRSTQKVYIPRKGNKETLGRSLSFGKRVSCIRLPDASSCPYYLLENNWLPLSSACAKYLPLAGWPDWARHSETRICNSPLFCCGSAGARAVQTWLGPSVSPDSTKISEIDTHLSDTRGEVIRDYLEQSDTYVCTD